MILMINNQKPAEPVRIERNISMVSSWDYPYCVVDADNKVAVRLASYKSCENWIEQKNLSTGDL